MSLYYVSYDFLNQSVAELRFWFLDLRVFVLELKVLVLVLNI